ncbi:hypothetical protein PFICI_11979 [Pestalotiopsis fici W106-1]|uniref:Uncharacterized protein n=1 Tax=Pestalotiopsis fici (strain W106-1 / CGMCC3.15140) TaxID=1229662 RepID=W3WTU2_PESFW|nr:uncharacterized protein PFICI_11979 [Pestalotiopsis fici W106-1]ETS76592.1 hypothetical protein PFICI_11979 [Pestalotiopsis fici W106-1]
MNATRNMSYPNGLDMPTNNTSEPLLHDTATVHRCTGGFFGRAWDEMLLYDTETAERCTGSLFDRPQGEMLADETEQNQLE